MCRRGCLKGLEALRSPWASMASSPRVSDQPDAHWPLKGLAACQEGSAAPDLRRCSGFGWQPPGQRHSTRGGPIHDPSILHQPAWAIHRVSAREPRGDFPPRGARLDMTRLGRLLGRWRPEATPIPCELRSRTPPWPPRAAPLGASMCSASPNEMAIRSEPTNRPKRSGNEVVPRTRGRCGRHPSRAPASLTITRQKQHTTKGTIGRAPHRVGRGAAPARCHPTSLFSSNPRSVMSTVHHTTNGIMWRHARER